MNEYFQDINIEQIQKLTDIETLEKLTKEYPYFSLPHTILSILKQEQSVNFNTNPALVSELKAKMEDLNLISTEEISLKKKEIKEAIIEPIWASDYFASQGQKIDNSLEGFSKENVDEQEEKIDGTEENSLLVQMTYAQWLKHIRDKKKMEEEEFEDKKALRSMWQKEKLAAAIQEESDEIPEEVFKMAVDSITNEEDVASESMANIYILQGKKEKAIDIYKKLILINPEKKVYFADKIDNLIKDI